ncbi:hypothetical protein ACHHYP_08373 [Achlya hypogyna]|uniref:Uncharacterized protein n=1 Tax=Achlya hypogyna TaxID=1202772 RepID=A0A1V9ZKZ5_ACHHY|nr:hypothetical protein ACHHYP_08373 [Achlya hypogyna]
MQTWKLALALAVAAAITGAEKSSAKAASEKVNEVALLVDGDVRASAVTDVDDKALLLGQFRPGKGKRDATSTSLRCRMCGAHLAWKNDHHAVPRENKEKAKSFRTEPSLGPQGEVMYFDGPLGDEFELAAFDTTEAVPTEASSLEDTFFRGYNWRVLTCPRCARHVGWKFTHELQEDCMKRAKRHVAPSSASAAALATLKATVDAAFGTQKCHVMPNGWWSYQVCYKTEVRQYHQVSAARSIVLTRVQEPDETRTADWSMGRFTEDRSTEKEVIHFYSGGQHCDENGQARATSVKYVCCPEQPDIVVDTIDEPALCQYNIRVCVPTLCDPSSPPDSAAKKALALAEKREMEEACVHVVASTAPTVLAQFYALLWPDTLADDSRDLAWAKSLTTITSIGR